MSPKSEPTGSGVRICGIADALAVVGDRWALLVLREVSLGVHRFTDIRTNTGAPRDTLVARLHELEAAGLIARRRYCDRPPRDEYVLTDRGATVRPVLAALRTWGESLGAPVSG